MTFVLVKWNDAAHPAAELWSRRSELDLAADLTVFTCGYLVHKDERICLVAVSVSNVGIEGGEQYAGIMTIPTGCIVDMQEMLPAPKAPAPKAKRKSR